MKNFPAPSALGLTRIEWTIDQDRLRENPLNTAAGQQEIIELSRRNGLKPASLTGDCFMQAPFWKADGETQKSLVDDLDLVLASCSTLGIEFVVIPLVDNGRIESAAQTETLLRVLLDRAASLSKQRVKIVFESDLPPAPLAQFIDKFPREVFGINYDSGNSAALGYDSAEEIPAYAPRILNVHVKDRLLGGTTVPLGTGAADLAKTIRLIEQSGYRGQYILQTARAADGDHAGALARYRDMTVGWIEDAQPMKLDIEGRVALVVGASRGIGLAIAETLAAEGARVAIAARGLDGIKSAAEKIGRGTSFHAADVTDPAAAQSLVEEVEKQWGRIDILVCNVGSGTSVPPGKETAAEWSRVMDLNLFAATNMIEAARPLMSRGQWRPRDRLRLVDLRARSARRTGDLFGGQGGPECDRARARPTAGA